jgi:alpha-amylase
MDKSNDTNFNRTKTTENYVVLGGDIKGIKKNWRRLFWQIRINAIWFTPIVEQIHDAVDEGTGLSYPFTVLGKRLDGFRPNFGTKQT